MAVSPIDGKTYYFIDKCLPFGASISCAHFQEFSNAIAHVVKVKSGKDNINYLDDFMFITMLKALCDGQVNLFIAICNRINFPVSLDKTFYSSTCMVFLGLLIDTVAQLVMIPSEKIEKVIELLTNALAKVSGKITVKECQRICGFLNFLGRAIVPGRAFSRHLYSLTANPNLKPHHHVRLTRETKKDLCMWLSFLDHPSVYAREFMDFSNCLVADEILMFSDAAKNAKLGYGCVCENLWMFGQWGDFIESENPSIAYLELYALTATVLKWIHRFSNRRVILFCDNQSIVQMVNNTTSKCTNCMVLIRLLVLKSLTENVRVFARYIESKANKAADYLSRGELHKFKSLKNSWDRLPLEMPTELVLIHKVWIC